MTNLESMMQLLCGRFDNRQQYEAMQAAGKPFPYAEHVNTVCNDKIRNLPTDFAGAFLLEESALEHTDTLRLTHEQIANHLGTAREVVTRMLRYFQSEGMVRLSRGTVAIADRRRLEALRPSSV